jgi:hypothetical protein
MKRIGIILAVCLLGLCFAQTTNTITITIPADLAGVLTRAHAAEYAANKSRAAKFIQTLTEDIAPSTVQGMVRADVATIIADKVRLYSPADLPARKSGESDIELRNRYQAEVKSKLTVK